MAGLTTSGAMSLVTLVNYLITWRKQTIDMGEKNNIGETIDAVDIIYFTPENYRLFFAKISSGKSIPEYHAQEFCKIFNGDESEVRVALEKLNPQYSEKIRELSRKHREILFKARSEKESLRNVIRERIYFPLARGEKIERDALSDIDRLISKLNTALSQVDSDLRK